MLQGPETNVPHGVVLIDKPAGITSFKVVGRLRRLLQIKKIGHAGTLDPFATGLLILCVGRSATRRIADIMEGEKEYHATVHLGVETETQDREGRVVNSCHFDLIPADKVEQALASFRGEILQVPPAYSALKHKGKPLYYYARRGIEVKKAARKVHIKRLERVEESAPLSSENPELVLQVNCTKGTYIRTLAADIGRVLGCGAHLKELRRTKSGCFQVENAIGWEQLDLVKGGDICLENLIPVEQLSKMLQ